MFTTLVIMFVVFCVTVRTSARDLQQLVAILTRARITSNSVDTDLLTQR